jgi:hypothetical protein
MTTDRLKGHYTTFTPDERLSLLVAAATREDGQEFDRLLGSAPRKTCRVSDVHSRADAFETVAGLHRQKSLEIAAFYLHTMSSAALPEAKGAYFRNMARLFGYLLRAHAAGWLMFCERRKLDPNVFAASQHGGALLEMAEGLASDGPVSAFTLEEARRYAAREGIDVDALLTDELVADDLEQAFRARRDLVEGKSL